MLLQKRNFIVFVFLFTLSGIAYWQLAYRIQRGDALLLLGTLMGLSLAFFYMMRYSLTLKVLFGLGLFFRLIFLFSVPELSQDFYRFLWDGNIQLLGLNPFTTAPDGLLGTIDFPLLDSLYSHMGSLSASHTSSYPPLSQWLFKGVMYFNQTSILDATLLLRLCLMVFALISELEQHIDVHKWRQEKCELCNKRVDGYSKLKHMTMVHKLASNTATYSKLFGTYKRAIYHRKPDPKQK